MDPVVDVVPSLLLVALAVVTRFPAGGRWRYPIVAAVAAAVWYLAGSWGWAAALHRPLLVYALATFPDGRVRRPAATMVVVVALGEATLGRAFGGPVWLAVLAGAIGWLAVDAWQHAPRRLRRPVAGASVLVAMACAVVAAAHVADPAGAGAAGLERTYAVLVIASLLVLITAAVDGRGGAADAADAVVELANSDIDPVVGGIAVHDADPVVAAGLRTASRLFDEHRRLDAELSAQIEAARAARRRLVEVADREAGEVDRLLTAGAAPTIAALAGVIGPLTGSTDDDVAVFARRILTELDELSTELARIVHGLPPSRLADGGLAAALNDIAGRTSVVALGDVPTQRYPSSVEATVWYVCAEATANAVKHTDSARITIDVCGPQAGVLTVAVADDGPGGARPEPGGGLAGLIDRVEAVGGRLVIDSPVGAGTRVIAEVPVG